MKAILTIITIGFFFTAMCNADIERFFNAFVFMALGFTSMIGAFKSKQVINWLTKSAL
ncbi:hypothetical protein KRE40_03525 [Elizabethkingia meningoseptica]|uniref:hypothetical protein n=1 Tax=Elizabethkingia meningoseptica TaxID=238 RepID=UPI0023B1C9A2|nr:hypothetical protein [Elizabethkingia meningoseptica]MDE5507721.1 hypothetical protein [Elizabethkingia meningoseptica]